MNIKISVEKFKEDVQKIKMHLSDQKVNEMLEESKEINSTFYHQLKIMIILACRVNVIANLKCENININSMKLYYIDLKPNKEYTKNINGELNIVLCEILKRKKKLIEKNNGFLFKIGDIIDPHKRSKILCKKLNHKLKKMKCFENSEYVISTHGIRKTKAHMKFNNIIRKAKNKQENCLDVKVIQL